MIPLTIRQIAELLNATLTCPEQADKVIDTVGTDSREVAKGSLFVALKGERFDAHDFLPQVAAAGAGAILSHNPEKAAGIPTPCILVPDTRKALGQLGHAVRGRLGATRVIAIGGSNGKTTTKHLVGSVLAARFAGTQSPKSFNNDLGVPLTLLGARAGDDYVVLELGTNHPGELSPLSVMAEPEIAAITSIGPEHLEGFGDLDGVRREEAALLDGLRPEGLLIVNGDDAPLLDLIQGRAKRVITFGFGAGNDLRIDSVESSLQGIRFSIHGIAEPFTLPLPGKHNASNALVALAIGRELGMSDTEIRKALADCSRPEMRMQILYAGKWTILNDAYNANPASMQAALETIGSARLPGRRIAVLGEMRELGATSADHHREIGRLAAQSNLDALICVGEGTRETAVAAIQAGLEASRVRWVADASVAAGFVPGLLQDNDTLLLKGSRGVKLEVVAEAVAKAAGVELSLSH